jgi:uncharacterized protein (TIGR02246 family)
MKRVLLLLMILGFIGTSRVFGDPPRDQSVEEAAIRKMVDSYVQAFNSHDAESLASHWSPDAVYLNRTTGEEVVGRAAVVEQFRTLLKEQPKLKVEVNVESIQFISPTVAVEHGKTKLLSPNAEPEEIDYTAVDVKRDGKWLLDRVTDKTKEIEPSNYEQLKALEWMVGEWTGNTDDAEVEVDCDWTKNKNFLTRAFKISIDGETSFSGMQIVGWDAAKKTIRSWTFDSKGTFAEATWQEKGDRWFLRNRGTLPDGRTATMINVMKKVDANSFTWQTVDRTAGSELLPNINEIQLVRR